MAELYSKNKKGGAKGEKERALQGLVKSGKGVTVVGKSEKEMSKGRKRDGDDSAREDGKRLKL
jgi:U3 small nucleolar RNA-associated protein MPP10